MNSLLETVNRMKPQLLTVTTVVLTGLLISYSMGWFDSQAITNSAPSGPPPANVEIDKAAAMEMKPHTVLPGSVVSMRDAVIAAETSGKILSVVDIGDEVGTEDNLAVIDDTDAKQVLNQRKAELQGLRSLHKYHSDYFKRIEEYDHKLGLSAIAIAELRSNLDTAAADVARGVAALNGAQIALDRTQIKAPFAGSVVSQAIQTGEYAQTGTAIVRLVDTINLEVSAQVPASLVQPIKKGTLIEVSGMGRSVMAPVRALVPVGDSINRTMELRISLKDTGFLVGTPVRVTLATAQPKEVVAVPRDALILRSNSQYIFVVDEDNVAHKQDVLLGYAEGEMIEVIGDVSSNATVIIRGGERLRDGQSVSWGEAEPKTTSEAG
ncbi:MAG: efflux RND transporter periplasmic adaptor subunit [Arenicella sp.]|nr:efflux RND transporter periplasmic adaptor subunit [Arenicella sp.]